jgi:hypothetical protein
MDTFGCEALKIFLLLYLLGFGVLGQASGLWHSSSAGSSYVYLLFNMVQSGSFSNC